VENISKLNFKTLLEIDNFNAKVAARIDAIKNRPMSEGLKKQNKNLKT
jgi:hypothetical protein